MSITIKKSYFITKKIKRNWEEMEKIHSVTPFLYYNFMKNVIWNSYLRLSIPIFYYAENDRGEIKMIAPMKYLIKERKLDSLGNTWSCDISDFLFAKDVKLDEKKSILMSLKKVIGHKYFISRIIETSDLITALQGQIRHVLSQECVDIEIQTDAESHFANLSKSVRQNIRTAYNRLNRNKFKYEYTFLIGGHFPNKIKKETKSLYYKRQTTEYFRNKSITKRIISSLFIRFFRHDNYSLYNNENAVLSVLYIDNKPAAMFAGILNHKHDRVVIPRLAIDINYKFYSPGYILLNETIKHCIDNTNIRHIDLCRGTEKYKIDMGGKVYSTEYVEVN